MTGGLNELAASLGLEPLIDIPSSTPRFSTIVRTQGRRPDSLVEALRGIAAQTYDDHETLLIVHHPDPATADTVEAGIPDDARPPGLRVIRVTDGDRSRPLNVGLEEASGDYVCILDDDDLVTDDWLAAFARGVAHGPGTMIRAIALGQHWTSDGGYQPVRATGPAEREYPDHFDLLAHLSINQTPPCSVSLPLAAMRRFGLTFGEELLVYEDWDLFVRVAMICGVTSIDDETSIFRHLDHGSSGTEVGVEIWQHTHTEVIERFAASPLLLPIGDARRVATAHFIPGADTRLAQDLRDAEARYDALSKSPVRFVRVFVGRLVGAVKNRLRRPG